MTLGQLVEAAVEQLRAAGIENPRRDARVLIAAVLDCAPQITMAYPQRPVAPKETQAVESVIARRAAREPVSRIMGEREFWSLPFLITPAVLDPRADSETLVEGVLAALAGRAHPWRLLDLGTGSGCLLLALLSALPQAWGLGVDISYGALAVARENARQLELAGRSGFLRGNWCDALSGRWDVIVSNPPYIASADIPALDPEVRCHDPVTALDGGGDGMAAYRALLPAARRCLAPRGLLALEVGAGQASAVSALLRHAGFGGIESKRDLGGVARCLLARR